MTKEQILKAAKSLSVDDRIDIADELFATLGPDERDEIDKAWGAEAERRMADLESGKTKAIPGPKVFKQLRTKYAK